MTAAFVDTSAIVAVALAGPRYTEVAAALDTAEDLFAAPLLEAEYRATLAREGVAGGLGLLDGIRWVLPDRPLSVELERVFNAGYQRGADAWHLASALFLAGHPPDLAFVSLDERQRAVAAELGFQVIP